MDFLTLGSSTFWLILGVILVVLEATGIQGLGLLFAGLGSITLGSLMVFGVHPAEATVATLVAFFFLYTIIWAAVLWKPLKKLNDKSKSKKFSEIIGYEVLVDQPEGLVKDKIGHVKWSGARMRAILSENSTDTILENNKIVWVVDKIDGVLVVDGKKPVTQNN